MKNSIRCLFTFALLFYILWINIDQSIVKPMILYVLTAGFFFTLIASLFRKDQWENTIFMFVSLFILLNIWTMPLAELILIDWWGLD
ncbi:hypothetical protein [Halobacillus sp. B23F22_1]|uniref:hypothetical protein n=1 Tax=Halobacillus sp. B23F22_1 TaxID=3459514 RepID=UPI00373E6CCB